MPTKPLLTIRALRAFFVVYTAALIVATHWPGLAIKGPFSRMDLVVHCCVFGLWTLMLGLSGWVKVSCCICRRALVVGLIGIGFGLLDETTQPMFSRVFDWLDVAADMTGAILASFALLILWHRQNSSQSEITDDSVAHPDADARS